MQVECCICRDWRDKENKKLWFTPTAKQRREHYFAPHHNFSHGYCPHCTLPKMKADGFTDEEIAELVKESTD